MTKAILEDCIEIVKDLGGNETVYFPDPLAIRLSTNAPSYPIWAVACSPLNELYLMDNNEEWHQVSLKDPDAAMILGILFQRLNLMRLNYAKAS